MDDNLNKSDDDFIKISEKSEEEEEDEDDQYEEDKNSKILNDRIDDD